MTTKTAKKYSPATELRRAVAGSLKITQIEAAAVIGAVFDAVKSHIKEKGSVRIDGFGVFKKQDRPARKGYDPIKKTYVDIKASSSVSFRNAKALKEGMTK